MCKQFYADHLYKLNADMIVGDHVEFKKDRVFCIDHEGDWYYCNTNFSTSSNEWPPRRKKGIQLYRNYWTHIPIFPDSEFGRIFNDLPKTMIK